MQHLYYKNPENFIYHSHAKTPNPQNADFHLHESFEIYFFISGNVKYFIEKNIYYLEYGDLLVMNNSEIHKATFLSKNKYERITIHFDSSFIKTFNSPSFNLLGCFTNRPTGKQNKIKLDHKQVNEILLLLGKIENSSNKLFKGYEILLLTSFIELLYYINNVFTNTRYHKQDSNVPAKIMTVGISPSHF